MYINRLILQKAGGYGLSRFSGTVAGGKEAKLRENLRKGSSWDIKVSLP